MEEQSKKQQFGSIKELLEWGLFDSIYHIILRKLHKNILHHNFAYVSHVASKVLVHWYYQLRHSKKNH